MKYSWRHSAQELRLQGGIVGVVSPPLALLLLPSTRLFYAPPLSSEKSLPPQQSLPILLASLVRSMSIFVFSLEVMMLNSKIYVLVCSTTLNSSSNGDFAFLWNHSCMMRSAVLRFFSAKNMIGV